MSDLQEQQRQFANYLRNPVMCAPPVDVELRRMEVYRDIFFRNMLGLLSSLFPVVKRVLSEDAWRALVRDFYANHRCNTPLFPSISAEFVAYLSDERCNDADFPFLAELAKFEWIQIALQNSQEELPVLPKDVDQYLAGRMPILSPLCVPMVCEFPVQRIALDGWKEQQIGLPVYLLIYRNHDDQVKVIESGAATFRLLQLLQSENAASIENVVTQLAEEMSKSAREVVSQQVIETVMQFLDCGVLVAPQ